MEINVQWAKEKRKGYPHFDAPICLTEAIELVTNPQRVAQHQFYPFLEYKKETRKFKSIKKEFNQEKDRHYDSQIKERPIKFAAHRDAYIYSYYREMLYENYEKILVNKGISDEVIAYRRIPVLDNADEGKCNIHYASEAFAEVKKRKNCVAITLDIKGFFESLDHKKILQGWLKVMGFTSLLPDHQKIFDNITRYHVVDLDECLERLGYLEFYKLPKPNARGDAIHKRYLKSTEEMFSEHMQLCEPKEFREKIAGSENGLIKSNIHNYGIPQGSPLSDIIANIYMLEFDEILSCLARKVGAYYRRYSDDIFWICNSGDKEIIIQQTRSTLKSQGSQLFLNDQKQTVSYFVDGILVEGKKFEYLGFGYDGFEPYIKEQTIQRWERRVVYGIRSTLKKLKKHAKSMNAQNWEQIIDRSALHSRYRFPDFEYNNLNGSLEDNRNFMTYVLRAKKIMKVDFIKKHFAESKSFINKIIDQEIDFLNNY